MEMNNFTLVKKCYVIITDLAISLVLPLLGKKFDFVQEIISRRKVRAGWARD